MVEQLSSSLKLYRDFSKNYFEKKPNFSFIYFFVHFLSLNLKIQIFLMRGKILNNYDFFLN